MPIAHQAGPGALVEALRGILAARTPTAEANEGATPAGVLIPLHYHDDDWHVIFNVRSEHVGQHKGEVAFPGGRLEPEDPDMRGCALREAWEEMGIRPNHVDVIGPLDAMLTRSQFLVWPIVGVVPHPYEFKIDEREVAEVFDVPVSHLIDPAYTRHEARLLPDGTMWKRVSYASEKHMIFGVTAWIMAQLVEHVNTALHATDREELAS